MLAGATHGADSGHLSSNARLGVPFDAEYVLLLKQHAKVSGKPLVASGSEAINAGDVTANAAAFERTDPHFDLYIALII